LVTAPSSGRNTGGAMRKGLIDHAKGRIADGWDESRTQKARAT
jgi:hypothetical protein